MNGRGGETPVSFYMLGKKEKKSSGSCLGADDIRSHLQQPSPSFASLNRRLQSDHFKAAMKKPLCSLPWQRSPSASAAVTPHARPTANQTIRAHFMKSSRSVRPSVCPFAARALKVKSCSARRGRASLSCRRQINPATAPPSLVV